MTYRETVAMLKNAGIDNPERDASLLIEKYCGVPEYSLLAQKDVDFNSSEFLSALQRRINREPLQYIFGSWYFYGLEFSLNTHTLCPRSDTEILAEEAINTIPKNAIFADCGTGSGCIAGAVLYNRHDLRAKLFDISSDALDAAKTNLDNLQIGNRAEYCLCDMLADDFYTKLQGVDVLVSNPPYIPTADIDRLEPELMREPIAALDGGKDGLVFYRSLVSSADKAGINYIMFEIGIGEHTDVEKIGIGFGYTHKEVKDLSGIVRVILLNREKE